MMASAFKLQDKNEPKVKTMAKIYGFTLIELIVGIVLLSISFSLIITLILPLSEKSAEQIHQVRASELGQSIMNEILARAFDENSDMAGGLVRCSGGTTECTSPDQSNVLHLGPDGTETRQTFNDVDDYDDYDSDVTDDDNALGSAFSSLYPGFRVQIDVCYSNFNGTCNNSSVEIAKLITITVTTPQDSNFIFSFYRANY
ncbi:MAG: type II secretion system protein [Colwellia sp.]|nr:type II secretion system protein [Colwellia sp.]